MKIEKVNENQIRCTLTREDLASRELKISELAYGTEKAKNLFRDMMRQANYEFGFEAEDIPLMIEAVPLNAECIVLIITKVEDPEELDTRFSRFAPSVTEDDEDDDYIPSADDVLDLFQRIQGEPVVPQPAAKASDGETEESGSGRIRIYAMDSLSLVISAASLMAGHCSCDSRLYKDAAGNRYLLLLSQSGEDSGAFDKLCNTASEYGSLLRPGSGSSTFLSEHCEALIPRNAIEALSGIAG